MKSTITLCIVEDDDVTRRHLVELVNEATASVRLQCVGSYSTAEAALKDIAKRRPDVALVDINLPGISGIECVERLKNRFPDLAVLMLTKFEESELIFKSLRAGANGYVLKKMLSTELIPAIDQVNSGGAPMSMQVARKVVAHFRETKHSADQVDQLTSREQEILTLLAKGNLYKEIAISLGISESTVRAHLRNIYKKLQVRSRTEAAIKFLARG